MERCKMIAQEAVGETVAFAKLAQKPQRFGRVIEKARVRRRSGPSIHEGSSEMGPVGRLEGNDRAELLDVHSAVGCAVTFQ